MSITLIFAEMWIEHENIDHFVALKKWVKIAQLRTSLNPQKFLTFQSGKLPVYSMP